MAYAALSSLMHTLQQLLQPNQQLVCESSIQQHVESVYQSLHDVQVFLENATKEAKDIETLKVVEKRIRDVVYIAEDRVDSSLRSVILADNGDNREGARRSFFEELLEVEKEVDSLKKEVMLIDFNKNGFKSAEATTTSSSSRRYATDEHNPVVGMESDFNTILDRLTAETKELIVIPIVGMGGIGKSTLARKVYDDSCIRSRFDKHAWVTVSESYNERQTLLEFVSSITGSNREKSNDQLMEDVHRGLMRRRFLIVIDDIWSTEAWDQNRRIVPNDDNKSRILLTTRLKEVADYASSPEFPPYDMPFLSFGESWILFTERLFREDPYPPQLEEIGKHIVKQCRGLPLSIVVVAGLLGKMEPTHDNWEKVEENLSSFFGTVAEQCQAILSLSYNYLPQHLKACFLYVGGFPEDMEIRVLKLIRLWIAEQFVKERSTQRLEVVAEEYLQELIDRSLILAGRRRANGRMKTCKIHDLLRQLCIREAQIEIFLHVLHVNSDQNVPIFSEGINYGRRVIVPLVFNPGSVFPEWGESDFISTIRTFVFPIKYTIFNFVPPCSIISHFELLKVLDLYSIRYCDISGVIPQLVHLRYVAGKIDKAPSLAKLWNLQTIILHNRDYLAKVELLPEIWTKTELRHLDTETNIPLPDPLEAESHGEQHLCLNNLQTLALNYSPFLAEILRRTPNLIKLKIASHESLDWPAILDSLILLHQLETLSISGHLGRMILSSDIYLPNLKQLRLHFSNLTWKDMSVLANLPNLEVLKTHGGFRGQTWMLNEDVVFQKLKYLRLKFANLERWEATSDNFPMLERLILIGMALKEIPQSIGDIPTLKLIQIDGCSSAAATSAKKIKEEQESYGNSELQVRIREYFDVRSC